MGERILEEYLVVAAIAAVFLALGLAVWTDHRYRPVEGTVIAKSYEGARSGIGTGIGTNGGVSTVTTYSGEKYQLLIKGFDKFGGARTDWVTVGQDDWIAAAEGERWEEN